MKYLTKLFSMMAVASLVIFMSCGGGNGDGGDDPEPAGQQVGQQLSAGTWAPNAGAVTRNSEARPEWSEAGFTLTFTVNGDFTGGNYSASNIPDFPDASLTWPTSGSWSFATDADGNLNTNTVIRDDGVEMSVTVSVDNPESPSSGTLTLQFDVPTPSAKIDGFDGSWSFGFSLAQ